MSKISLFSLCWLFAWCQPCPAGTISITTDAVTWVEGGRIHGKIVVTNRGTAKAHEVRADTEILGRRFGTTLPPKLEPGETTSFQFSKPVDPSLKGSFPLVVLVHFLDSNRHPFTALSCSTFFLGGKVDAMLSATAETLDLRDDGTLRFEIRNGSDQLRRVRSRLHLPRELLCPNPVRDVEVESRGKKFLAFPVRNLAALPGAGYPVFLALEYGSGPENFAVFSNGYVRIAKGGSRLRENRWYWALGFFTLLAWGAIRAVRAYRLTFTGKYV